MGTFYFGNVIDINNVEIEIEIENETEFEFKNKMTV